MKKASQDSIEAFLDALWMEQGLSENTLQAYRSDMMAFAGWLQQNRLDLIHAERKSIQDYLYSRVAGGVRRRTSARILSCLRRFYRYLLREGRIKRDPTELIAAPKLDQPLPKTLSEEQVEQLLVAPDTDTPLGLRDRAMLEILYATGLRVSELVTLELSRLNLEAGVVRVMGEGW